jgi:hypothetical protein
MRAKEEVVVVPRQHAHIRRRFELEWIAAVCPVKSTYKNGEILVIFSHLFLLV